MRSLASAVADLASRAFTQVEAGGRYSARLLDLRREAHAFFSSPKELKLRHHETGRTSGYRPIGIEYAEDAARPDQNEAFGFFRSTAERMREVGGDDRFRAALEAFLIEVEELCQEILAEVAQYFGATGQLPGFRDYSYLQVNYTPSRPVAVRAQDRHEDGHFVTVHYAEAPGLIAHGSEGDLALTSTHARPLILAGSTLTMMSGGAISPLFHSVEVPADAPARVAILYFMNLDPTQEIAPFVSNDRNLGVSVADYIDTLPLRFGLPRLTQS
jgi:isopenicillin N synthase-like dioxygenase